MKIKHDTLYFDDGDAKANAKTKAAFVRKAKARRKLDAPSAKKPFRTNAKYKGI